MVQLIAEVFHEWVIPTGRYHATSPEVDLDLFIRYMRLCERRWASAWLEYACGDEF